MLLVKYNISLGDCFFNNNIKRDKNLKKIKNKHLYLRVLHDPYTKELRSPLGNILETLALNNYSAKVTSALLGHLSMLEFH